MSADLRLSLFHRKWSRQPLTITSILISSAHRAEEFTDQEADEPSKKRAKETNMQNVDGPNSDDASHNRCSQCPGCNSDYTIVAKDADDHQKNQPRKARQAESYPPDPRNGGRL